MTIQTVPTDALKPALFDPDLWEIVLDEYDLDDIVVALQSFSQDLNFQLSTAEDPERAWVRSVKFLLLKVDEHLRDAKSLRRSRNKAHSDSMEAANRRWSSFAIRLCRALDAKDPKLLESIMGPGDGGISAKEWLDIRTRWEEEKEDARAQA